MIGSTRLRRTLLCSLAFTGVQVVIVAVASFAQLPATRRAHDSRLVRGAVAVSRVLPHDGSEVTTEQLQNALTEGRDLLYVELVEGSADRRVPSNPKLRTLIPELSAADFDSIQVGDVEIDATDLDASRTVRQVVVPFRDASGRRRTLRALARTSARGVALDRMTDRLWIVLPASFLAAAIVSWLLLRTTLSPLRRVAESVDRLGPESLTRGVGVLDAAEEDEEVVRLQRSLSEALERIEEGYQAQSQFVANVSHELKTPIAVMLAEAQSLSAESASIEDLRAFRSSAIQEMQRLGKMVESFLVVARAARGGALTRHEQVFLPEVVVDAVQHTSGLAREKRVTVRPRLPPPDVSAGLEISGDPELLGAMVENLIRNAVRYSPPDGDVDVTLSRAGEAARISVRDRGPGLPDGFAERLFDRYVQGGGESGRARGFGLGLSIAANVARLHGGSIDAANHEGGGADFRVSLPLERAAPGPRPA